MRCKLKKLLVKKGAGVKVQKPLLFLCLLTATLLSAQEVKLTEEPAETLRKFNQTLIEQAQTSHGSAADERQDYHIGAEDLVDISVFEVPELSRTVRVSAAGEISLPLIGAFKVAGLSPLELERQLTSRLKETYLKDPQVIVFLREFHSDPVSVVGAVKLPGLYHIQTGKSLVEILAMAQGFSEGPARLPGRDIVITRKTASQSASTPPHSDALSGASQSEQLAIVQVPIKQLLESGDPKWNVPIYPGDVVKVAQAGTVYVAGDVARPGGFPLTDFDNISAIQALSMAGGTIKTANRKASMIIRRDAVGGRVEQKVDLSRVLQGKDPDVMLGPNDILFVPGSVGKAAALRAIESTVQAATGMLIYHPF